MKILFVSRDFSGASLCLRLLREGNEVCAFVADSRYRQIMDGLVEKTADLDTGIDWVSRDGLVVVDDVGFGELQDRLRGEGYAVVGGSAGGDCLELDRVHCQQVLAPLAPHLRRIGFRGDFDLNCIVNEEGAFPLEATSRFGFPTTQLQMEFHISPWTEFLAAVARGEDYPLEVREGYGVVMLIAIPPFPYCSCSPGEHLLPRGLKIHFREEPDDEELRHFHFEEVSGAHDGMGRGAGAAGPAVLIFAEEKFGRSPGLRAAGRFCPQAGAGTRDSD